MDESATVLGIIEDVYDAALDPGLWPEALERTAEYVGGCASSVMAHDARDRSAIFYYSWGDDPEYTRRYFETYIKINPILAPSAACARVGLVTSASALLDWDEYRRSRFFKEWVAPQGYLDAAHAMLDVTPTSYASLGVVRHERQGKVDAEVFRRMHALLPHYRRAVLIGRAIEEHSERAAELEDALDRVSAGVFLVGADGEIRHANASGTAMLAQRGAVREIDGRLSAANPGAHRRLRASLLAASRGDAAVGKNSVSLELQGMGEDVVVAHVLPLTSGQRRRAARPRKSVAAVFVRRASVDLASPFEFLKDRYQLTAAELRILTGVVQLGGALKVAEAFGLSEATVRTHLAHLYAKTGAHGQVELVKLVASLVAPIRAGID